ncbi:MAG: hypothetical protein HZB71_07470 [Betaproteobacteria bacterium]|nr:hypothetical protein [Betaproteobacteria bacterium]
MKTALNALLTIFFCSALSHPVQAGQVADIQSTLAVTRQHTMVMLSEADRTVLEMRYEEALKSSKDLDALLDAAMKNAALQPKLTQFKAVWEAFKKTRDDEIIPAMMSGARDQARGLAQGVQAPRFKKMNELLESLPQ